MASRSMIIREAEKVEPSDERQGDCEDVLPTYSPEDKDQYELVALAEAERKANTRESTKCWISPREIRLMVRTCSAKLQFFDTIART